MENPALSQAFLDKLLVRLKSGDTRSIHLNALPGPFARIDVYDLIHVDPSLHLKFLNTLLGQREFRFSLHIDPQAIAQKDAEPRKILQRLVKKLNHLYYQEKEELAEHGYTSFAFGYPLLVKRDPANPEKILKAPLFIWYLSIEKDRRSNNTWILSRSEDQPVIFNEALRTHLATQEHIGTEAIDALLQEETLDEKQLLEACRILAGQLHFPYDTETAVATLLPGTNKESIEQLVKDHPRIRFSGIFGLYKTQKQAIIRDLEQLQQQTAAVDFTGHLLDIEDISAVPLDPSQENILHALKRHNNLVIQGPPGTGKSQSLTGIITTALLNKLSILVVCEKRTALDVLHQNLSALGLQDLCVLIEDVYADRKAIVERVRDKLEAPGMTERFREHAYEEARSEFLSQQEEVCHRLNVVREFQFGDDTWSELLARSLQLREDASVASDADALRKILPAMSFQLSFSEFQSIRKQLPEAEQLYLKLPADTTVFSVLHDETIRKLDNDSMQQKLVALLDETGPLLKRVEKNISQPAYDRLKGPAHYADRLFALFSSDRKKALEQQATDLQVYARLQQLMQQENLLNISLDIKMPENRVQEILPALKYLHEQLNIILQSTAGLQAYHTWRQFAGAVDAQLQIVLESLKQIRACDWKQVFSSYYLDEFIRHTAQTQGLGTGAENAFNRLRESDTALRTLLPARIRYNWEQRQQQLIQQRDTAQLKYLYNQRKNKQFETRNSLRHIVHADPELFRTLFPVALVNPVTCASVFPLEAGLYDLVILDEASQLKIEETSSSLYRGKTRVISGDKHQMPPSTLFGSTILFQNEDEAVDTLGSFLAESNSLLEYANDAGFPNHYLDFHYRSKHPKLIAFSNAAFYSNRLVPMPQRADYQPIHFYDTGGVYMDGTNLEEAKRVVEFLYQLEKQNDAYPSTGVATFNIFQRDLILDMLWEQAYAEPEKLAKLEALLQKGLFIKNLENIQGDERDVMILSTTFGKDEQGKFRQLFGPLTQEKGYQLLNVIITRARQSLHVFCSVPETVFMNYREELLQKGNTGKAIFYAYLAYARACSTNNSEQENAILEVLAGHINKNPNIRAANTNALINIVFEKLQARFGEDIQRNYPFGGFVLPIVVLKSGKPILSLESDEPDGYAPEVSYRQKLHREATLDTYGISTFHIWGIEYWKSPVDYLHFIQQRIEKA